MPDPDSMEAEGGDASPTRGELLEQARRMDIQGRSDMDGEELEDAIARHRGGTRNGHEDVE